MTIKKMAPRKYRITVELGHGAEGERKRYNETFDVTAAEARRIEREVKQRLEGGVFVKPQNMLVAEWERSWLPRHHAAGHIQESSRERYADIIRLHINPHIGALRLQSLRADHIADLRTRWLVEDGLSPATVHKQLTVLRRSLEDAVEDGLIARNPAERIRAPRQQRKQEQRALARDEVALLLTAAAGTAHEMPIRFSLATGVRRGELLALTWSDVDLGERSARVRGTKTGHSNRTIRISEQTVAQLRAHATAQKLERLRLGPIWEDHDRVFPADNGKPKIGRVLTRDSRAIFNRSGIANPETVKWHTLRHTAASLWIEAGMDIYSVSRRLGHASAAFTLSTYAHLMEGQDDALASALDALLA